MIVLAYLLFFYSLLLSFMMLGHAMLLCALHYRQMPPQQEKALEQVGHSLSRRLSDTRLKKFHGDITNRLKGHRKRDDLAVVSCLIC
ncbi:hypothetical protein HOY80DRAFT_962294 [Tuber brumale]|nr:hypothetical protein HOY80DRAFT_962294 [Tuber brumale]